MIPFFFTKKNKEQSPLISVARTQRAMKPQASPPTPPTSAVLPAPSGPSTLSASSAPSAQPAPQAPPEPSALPLPDAFYPRKRFPNVSKLFYLKCVCM